MTVACDPDFDDIERTLLNNWKFHWDEEICDMVYKPGVGAQERVEKKRKQKEKKIAPLAIALAANRLGSGRRTGKSANKNVRIAEEEHPLVTLQHIKECTSKMLDDANINVSHEFEVLVNTEEFNAFLVTLFYYFKCYFHKQSLIKKLDPTNIAPSVQEKAALDEATVNIGEAVRKLGQTYSSIVIGLGSIDVHHMNCGDSRVSHTLKDRHLYECFYDYLNFAVWITFRRQNMHNIKVELGGLLRSQMFNPATRKPCYDPLVDKPRRITRGEPVVVQPVPNESEYARSKEKRPPVANIVNLRSPALAALIPLPQEASSYLFKRKKGGAANVKRLCDRLINHNLLVDTNRKPYDGPLFEKIDINEMLGEKLGIIGERLEHFNPTSLMPLAAEGGGADGEGKADEEAAVPPVGLPQATGAASTAAEEARASASGRHKSAVSRATTEAAGSDEEDEPVE